MGVKIEMDYKGGLHCELVHGPSGNRIETDAPKDNAGRGEAFSPTDLVAAALASCAVTTVAIKAPKEELTFSGATAHVLKGMTTHPPRRIADLTLMIHLAEGTPPAQRPRLEEIARTCPVALSLSQDVKVQMQFVYDL